MDARVLERLDALSASLWFRPAVMVAATVVLYAGLRLLETHVVLGPLPWWIENPDADGARAILSTIVTAVVGVAGVTFSVTMAALIMAGSQYGPRLLRQFTADRGNQAVLGVFVSTALLGLLTLRIVKEGESLPHFNLFASQLLGFASLGALVYFIHHMAVVIQVDDLASSVAGELRRTLARVTPRPEEARATLPREARGAEAELEGLELGAPVKAEEMGYVQAVNEGTLVAVGREVEGVVRLLRRPGQLVLPGMELVRITPAAAVTDAVADRVRAAFNLGRLRSPTQDVQFSVHQLVEIALRALSPAMNDPFVAIACIDRLTDGLARLAESPDPPTRLRDDAGQIRVLRPVTRFADVLVDTFDHLRNDAARQLPIVLHLMEALRIVGARALTAEDRTVVRQQATLLAQAADAALGPAEDRERVQAAARRVGEEIALD